MDYSKVLDFLRREGARRWPERWTALRVQFLAVSNPKCSLRSVDIFGLDVSNRAHPSTVYYVFVRFSAVGAIPFVEGLRWT